MTQGQAVQVRRFPERLDAKLERRFLDEVSSAMSAERPRLVFDCTAVRRMDSPAIHCLLCCLEEAMKRNGDVRLAAVPAEAEAMLELTGAYSLFQTFDTVEEAAASFHAREQSMAPQPAPGPILS